MKVNTNGKTIVFKLSAIGPIEINGEFTRNSKGREPRRLESVPNVSRFTRFNSSNRIQRRGTIEYRKENPTATIDSLNVEEI